MSKDKLYFVRHVMCRASSLEYISKPVYIKPSSESCHLSVLVHVAQHAMHPCMLTFVLLFIIKYFILSVFDCAALPCAWTVV